MKKPCCNRAFSYVCLVEDRSVNEDSKSHDREQLHSAPVYIIRDEDSVWAAIAELAARPDITDCSVVFEKWQPSELYLRGTRYNATISFSAMAYLCDLQKKIYSTYASAKYGTYNSKLLSDEEKIALEIYISLAEGSSWVEKLEEVVERFFKELLNKMTGRQIVLIGLCFAVSYFGASTYKAYNESKLEERKAELEAKRQDDETKFKLALLQEQHYAEEQDIKRFEMMTQLATSNVALARIVQDSQDHYKQRLKLASKAEVMSANKVVVSGPVASELLKVHRPSPIALQLNGIYTVAKTNHKPQDGHMLTLTSKEDGRTFNAFLPNLFAGGENAALIANAYKKRPVGIKVNARMQDGEIVNAEIVGFYDPE